MNLAARATLSTHENRLPPRSPPRAGPALQDRAAALDEQGGFPAEDIAALARSGVLMAPLPLALGGLGWGTHPSGADDVREALRLVGRGNLAVGRLLEAHINAVRLVVRHGDPAAIAADVRDGRLFALWVTDPPGAGLTVRDGGLRGRKLFCSGAGSVSRAVVTARDPAGAVVLAIANLESGATATALEGGLTGMRAAGTGGMLFDGVPAAVFGAPDDYLRQPDFSCGAWRTVAVTLGGLEALVAEAIAQLRQRGRDSDPHQQARIGRCLIARESARLWVTQAARRGEDADADPQGAAAYVNLARLAVEQHCLDAIQLVQRSLGVSAFIRPNPIERLCRDLAVYLRQPAPDETLTEAASFLMAVEP